MTMLNAPAADEVEVSIFGPGFGEAIAVHLGINDWLLVDSCWQSRENKTTAVGLYLDAIGVPVSAVKGIVASHWHDDHIGGITSLLQKYTDARFYFPAYLSQKEGQRFVASYSGVADNTSRGTKEIYSAFRYIVSAERKRQAILAKTLMHEGIYPAGAARIFALSPTTEAWEKSSAAIHSVLQPGMIPKNVAEPKTNISSIVVHIDFGDDAILLGSDLESDGKYGWAAVLEDEWSCERTPSSLYKVAHHGSQTACDPLIWKKLLVDRPAAVLSPFVWGKVRLPLDEDVERIKNFAATLHATARPGRNLPKTTEAEKLMSSFLGNAIGRPNKMGHVRYRKKIGESTWRCETFGVALQL